MEKSNGGPVLPVCMMLHDIVNQLSVIIGNCDLVIEKASADSDYINRLRVISETAHRVVKTMTKHQCELTGLLRTARIVESAKPAEPLETANGGRKSPSGIDYDNVQATHHHAS